MSPNTLTPTQPYTLSYFITDPNDSTTYYVRAVVYDAITGEVLDTKNLTAVSTNSHLFTVRTQAPGDPSGHGRRIVVVATAYTDSGYTTKSSNYQEQSENYIVIKPGAGINVGGGGVDWYLVKEMIVEEVGKVSESLKPVIKTLKEILGDTKNIPDLIAKIKDLKSDVSGNMKDDSKEIEALFKILEAIAKNISSKNIAQKTDIKSVLDSIKSSSKSLREFIPQVLDKQSKKITFVLNEAVEKEEPEETEVEPEKKPEVEPKKELKLEPEIKLEDEPKEEKKSKRLDIMDLL